jgi:exodeoxyribonuclease VII large subunit
MPQTAPTPKIYTVSEITAEIRRLLEDAFPFMWLTGEISNCRMAVSGHCYFTLKDPTAQINAVIFRGQLRQLKFRPENGLQVTGMGRLGVYEPRGTYQIILEYLEPSGAGSLQVAFEQLKRKLADEGYFDSAHKTPLPFLPAVIAVVTSPSGSVVHDILNVLDRRFPGVTVEIVPVRVQGDGAESEVVSAIELVNRRARADVLILARGGGSLEDLQAFNSEAVAAAVYGSEVPIVSAIGHETDYTISDFVADVRAPTPSAAAELVVPRRDELLQRCLELRLALSSHMHRQLKHLKDAADSATRRLQHPRRRIQDHWQRLDELNGRLIRTSRGLLRRRRDRLAAAVSRLNGQSPLRRTREFNYKLDALFNNLSIFMKKYIESKSALLTATSERMQALNPAAVLQRGFSITRRLPEFTIVRDPAVVSAGDKLEITVARGHIICQVEGTQRDGQNNL